jgi:diguanylate cyclase (GGDEF)-like protein
LSMLHVPTLLIVSLMGVTIFSLSLTFIWWQDTRRVMIGYWALGYGLGCVGLTLGALREVYPVIATYGLGMMVLAATFGFVWAGFVRFEGKSLSGLPLRASAGSLLWAASMLIPAVRESEEWRGVIASLTNSTYLFLAAQLLWRGRHAEPLPSRLPLILLFSSHAALYFARVPATLAIWNDYVFGFQGKNWYVLLSLEAVVHVMACSTFIMMLIKDREQRHYRIAADVDGLTGLANRTSFVRRASRRIDQEKQQAQLLLFDLDHFKAINDTYGHEAGDKALVAFAQTVSRLLPPRALLGRVGGEEFACLLKRMELDSAHDWAEQVRRAVSDIELSHHGHRIRLNVSIGLATTHDCLGEFDLLLAAADDALYRAKRAGRNCVRHYSPSARLQHFLPGHHEMAEAV